MDFWHHSYGTYTCEGGAGENPDDLGGVWIVTTHFAMQGPPHHFVHIYCLLRTTRLLGDVQLFAALWRCCSFLWRSFAFLVRWGWFLVGRRGSLGRRGSIGRWGALGRSGSLGRRGFFNRSLRRHGRSLKIRGVSLTHSWWRQDMETLDAFLILCEGNPPVMPWFSPQKASDAGLILYLLAWTSCSTNCCFADDMSRLNTHDTSPQWPPSKFKIHAPGRARHYVHCCLSPCMWNPVIMNRNTTSRITQKCHPDAKP